ncbi:hypothetical protein PGT21_005847 [Puccinia graminis f. sp. tritici]|uniref:Uncharacterized protein n=1 Tax=Puccinia graminis f. sp. tritici TaxID=56615 RepID=A0A5B0PSR8_PUCGR|nr:hypothetical protein PGT21_005847 [Puccinia graminis f. sp. tritici]
MISGNGTYGIKKAIEITSANAFKAFTTEAIRVYPSKVIFCLEMKDPREIVKAQTQVSMVEAVGCFEWRLMMNM